MEIQLSNLKLCNYNSEKFEHKDFLLEMEGDSKSSYIHDIKNRLLQSCTYNNVVFNKGYKVSVNDKCVGYIFISKVIKDEIFLEYSVIKKYRGKGIGKMILGEVSDYLLDNYNLKSVILDIDPSNVPSVMTAISCGYIEDDIEYLNRNMNGKILYRRDNYSYINKRKK